MSRLEKFLYDYGFIYHLNEWGTLTTIRHSRRPRITVRITPELWQDLMAYHNIDAESELIALIKEQFTYFGKTNINELLGIEPLKRLTKFKLQ